MLVHIHDDQLFVNKEKTAREGEGRRGGGRAATAIAPQTHPIETEATRYFHGKPNTVPKVQLVANNDSTTQFSSVNLFGSQGSQSSS